MQSPAAVLLADVIASGRQRRLREVLARKLREASRAHLHACWIRMPYAVTAGDEFQVIATRPEALPEIILDLHRRLRPLRLRMGAGVGSVRGPLRAPVNRLQGEAFVRARQAIDQVKSGALHKYPSLTAFRTGRASLDEIINLIYGLNDTLLLGVTLKQWQAMDTYGFKRQVQRTARALRLNKSAVSRRLKRGRYWQFEEAVRTLQSLLRSAFSRLP